MSATSQSSLEGELPLATGATPGMGRAVALRLARDGVKDRGRQHQDRHEVLEAMVGAVAAQRDVSDLEVWVEPAGGSRARLRGRHREQEQLGHLVTGIRSGRS